MSLSGVVTSLLPLVLAALLLPPPSHVTGAEECGKLTCLNGGTCRDDTDNVTCHCPQGFTDDNCSTAINPCDSSSCGNGTCIPKNHTYYSCSCNPGFTGTNCSTAINPCDSSSCGNGTCIPKNHTYYSCSCNPGFTGANCSTEISGGSDGNQECDPPCNKSASKGDVNLAAVIGGCVTAALVLALVLVVLVIRCRQRRARTGGKRFTRIVTRADNGFSPALEEGSSSAMEMQPVGAANHQSCVPHTRLTPEALSAVVAKARDHADFLAAEFEQLPRGVTQPATVALNEHNKGKNRYRGICAYDHSRVVLSLVAGRPHSDYINACFLDGYNKEKAYIAAQGPTDVNVEDFLRMIWEKKVEKIAMLTRPTEMGQMKCVQYWNDEAKVTFGAFAVTVVSCLDKADLTVRLLLIQPADGAVTTVTHFLFKSWPDKGVPDSPWPLIDFRHKLMTSPSTGSAPILVHCSAGVGRTGTLVALDLALRRLQEDGGVVVPELVASLRRDRMDLVQTLAQYTFLHEAALVGLVCIGRFVPLERFNSDAIGSRVALTEEEFKVVRECVRPLSPDHCRLGNTPEYHAANRRQDILPLDGRVVWLSEPVQDYTDYINAVYLPSYTRDRRYVLTQTPLPGTVVNFWRAVFEADVRVIVSLDITTPDLQADVGDYIPVAQPVLQVGPLTLKLLQSRSEEGFVHRTIQAFLEGQGVRTVEQCEVSQWPGWEEVPPDPDLMLAVCQVALEWSPPAQGRILVHCRDGSRRSGLYVALSTLLERSSSEAEVAVPYVVGVLASVRPQALPSQEQYVFLYTAMRQHARNSSEYENASSFGCRQEKAGDGENVNSTNDEDLYANAVHEDLYVNAAMLKHA